MRRRRSTEFGPWPEEQLARITPAPDGVLVGDAVLEGRARRGAVDRRGDSSVDPVVLGELTAQGRPEFVGVLRDFARDLIRTVHPESVDAIELITSELLGNAIRHTRSREPGETVRLRIDDEGATVKVAVTDRGGAKTVPAVVETGDPLSVSGRGLWLVRMLSNEWGTESSADGGTTVWSRIGVDGRARGI